MTKARHNGRRKASALGKTGAERSVYVMKRESLAVVKILRLMDDTFMSKCLENAPDEGRHVMCKAVEEFAERREARCKRETMIATAKRLLANGKLMLKEIAECTGLSLAQVKKLQPTEA